ncbi:hypothetical protein [uncultured Desulfovibrio sp.]|nr:hypothetical protein [uncultured Desulfovibrio sp.]
MSAATVCNVFAAGLSGVSLKALFVFSAAIRAARPLPQRQSAPSQREQSP